MPTKSDIPVIDETNPQWMPDVSKWKMKDSTAWNTAIKAEDYDTVVSMLAGVVDSFPNGQPITRENFNELSLVEYAEIALGVQDAMIAIFRGARKGR